MNQRVGFLKDFQGWMLIEKGASPRTVESYQSDLLDLASFIGVPLEKAGFEDLEHYLKDLKKRGFQPSTQARKISAIKQFFSFLHRQEIIPTNPSKNVRFPKQTRSIPSTLSVDEVQSLLDCAYSDLTPEGIRLACILEMMYASGMRVSEIVSLPFSAIRYNLSTGVIDKRIVIKGKDQKERMVPLTQKAIESIMAYLSVRINYFKGNKSNWFFPSGLSHITRQRLGQLLKELALKAGIAKDKVSPHVIRHAFATHLLQNGTDLIVIQKLLGHSDISTTQIYTHLDKSHLMELVDKFHPMAHSH